MALYVQRETYLRQLIDRKDNGEIKIITGPRRCGKSWLLNRIYKDYLLQTGVDENHIIIVSFDMDSEEESGDLTDRQTLKGYLYSRITSTEPYYIILDEVQEVESFEKIVNGLNAKDNIDIYITGSNSHFLSSDILQSAFAIDDEEKRQQELNSLLKIDDSFRKIIIPEQPSKAVPAHFSYKQFTHGSRQRDFADTHYSWWP